MIYDDKKYERVKEPKDGKCFSAVLGGSEP